MKLAPVPTEFQKGQFGSQFQCPRHSSIHAVPDLHAGVFTVILVCIPRKGAGLLAESPNNCQPLETIAGSFSEARLVSRATQKLVQVAGYSAVKSSFSVTY